mmetsp:Transcript_13170/g.39228  ORF Transcript_13170/g.39228 Transcript_13170/m.39228 type:complete len:157 (+) Transcript_13170:170-640(+)
MPRRRAPPARPQTHAQRAWRTPLRRACLAAAAAWAVAGVGGFSWGPAAPRRARGRRRTALNCICVNCKFVDNCTAYHIVEAKHGQPHVALKPEFTPRNPTVAINVFPASHLESRGVEVELDVTACDDFSSEPGRWVKMMPKGTLLKNGFDPDFVPT